MCDIYQPKRTEANTKLSSATVIQVGQGLHPIFLLTAKTFSVCCGHYMSEYHQGLVVVKCHQDNTNNYSSTVVNGIPRMCQDHQHN